MSADGLGEGLLAQALPEGPSPWALQLQFWLLRLSAYALLNLADDAALLALMFC